LVQDVRSLFQVAGHSAPILNEKENRDCSKTNSNKPKWVRDNPKWHPMKERGPMEQRWPKKKLGPGEVEGTKIDGQKEGREVENKAINPKDSRMDERPKSTKDETQTIASSEDGELMGL